TETARSQIIRPSAPVETDLSVSRLNPGIYAIPDSTNCVKEAWSKIVEQSNFPSRIMKAESAMADGSSAIKAELLSSTSLGVTCITCITTTAATIQAARINEDSANVRRAKRLLS